MASLVSARRLRTFFFPDRARVLPLPYLIVATAGIALGLLIAMSDPGQRVEWDLYDVYSRRHAAVADPAPDLVVVAIDEPSFTEIGLPWPWPRSLHAALVDQLSAGGARSIAFDVLFDLPATNRSDDDELADAMRRAGNVILAADRAVVDNRSYSVAQWNEPVTALAQAAAAVGVVRIPLDPDGVLRRAQLTFEGRPSFALAIGARQRAFNLAEPDASAPRLVRFNGEPRRGIVTVSYYQALDAENSLPAGVFLDKHVLVGRALDVTTTIDARADHFRTPVAVQMPGVEVHATIVDALLRERFVADPFAQPERLVALSVIIAAAIVAATFFVSPGVAAALTALTIALILTVGYISLGVGLRLPTASPAIVVATAYALTASYRFALVSNERRMIKRAFQHYVAPAIVDKMLADPSQLRLGGEQYEVTVLFSDLEGFTSLSEHLSPAELSAHLGEYFTDMLDVLLPQGGTLDKLIGDAIMMYFGCPIRDERHAVQACRAALAAQRAMTRLNERWGRESLPRLRTRIGLNTGVAVAGNMGTRTIFNYTLLGDAVNLASRLEGVNKEYGTLTIIGEDTWQRVHGEFDARELDWIRVKGKERPVAIYELVAEAGAVDAPTRELFKHYADGLHLYRLQRWSDAAAAFERALHINRQDGPSRLFAARCAYYGVNPPRQWDGVHVMQSK